MIQMENREYEIQKTNYHHLILDGTQYEVGQQLAQMIEKLPGGKEFVTSGKIDYKKVGFPNFDSLWDYSEECCPRISQEIQGFADHFDVTPDKIPFWNGTFNATIGGECSQLAVLPPISQNKRTYVGRSYEWNHREEDLKLITTRVKGKADHIGFSCMLHGRHDGMNEHGLVVSMTGGGIFGVPFKHRGSMFWLTIRALLDTCTSVDSALKYLETLPMTGFFIYVVMFISAFALHDIPVVFFCGLISLLLIAFNGYFIRETITLLKTYSSIKTDLMEYHKKKIIELQLGNTNSIDILIHQNYFLTISQWPKIPIPFLLKILPIISFLGSGFSILLNFYLSSGI